MHDIALVVFAAAVAIAALSMITASARLRRIRPGDPATESDLGFAETFARRSLYGVVLSGHHRRVGDRRLTILVYVCRAAMLMAVASGLYWKLG
jgi:hypothetical protein